MKVIDKNTKNERMEIRLTPKRKKAIVKAANYSGAKSMSAFMVDAAYKSAKSLIEKEERILASEKDKETFFSALFDSETKPNEALLALSEEYNNAKT